MYLKNYTIIYEYQLTVNMYVRSCYNVAKLLAKIKSVVLGTQQLISH